MKVDDTDAWNLPSDLAPLVRRIFSCYVFDYRLQVHCCSLTPAFECHFCESQFESSRELDPDESERVADFLLDGDSYTEMVSYYTVREYERIPECGFPEGFIGIVPLSIDPDPDDVEEDGGLEFARETFCANPI